MGCVHSGPDPVQDKLVLGLAIKTSSSWNRKMPDPKASCRHEWGGGDPSRGCGVWGDWQNPQEGGTGACGLTKPSG